MCHHLQSAGRDHRGDHVNAYLWQLRDGLRDYRGAMPHSRSLRPRWSGPGHYPLRQVHVCPPAPRAARNLAPYPVGVATIPVDRRTTDIRRERRDFQADDGSSLVRRAPTNAPRGRGW